MLGGKDFDQFEEAIILDGEGGDYEDTQMMAM